ncbi:hypothetical protein TNCV_4457651 [Trichonephila clavipes]|nr:hypothetical protein TNCV_4457651 [Trichonephila clavipes]
MVSHPDCIVTSDTFCCAVGPGFDSGAGGDVYKCIVPLWEGGTLNIPQAESPLVRLVKGEERWVALGPTRVLSQKGTRLTSKIARRKRADHREKPHWPELEEEINKWILKERDDGKAVSTVSIRMKARVIAREMNIVNFSGGPVVLPVYEEKQFSRSTVGQKLPDDWGKKI